VILLLCLYLRVFLFGMMLDYQSSTKKCIELPSCNVKILASLKITSFGTLFVGLLIMCSILLYTLLVGQILVKICVTII
jgi:hypothetical protein